MKKKQSREQSLLSKYLQNYQTCSEGKKKRRLAFLPVRDGMKNVLCSLLRRTTVLLATGQRLRGINHKLPVNIFCYP